MRIAALVAGILFGALSVRCSNDGTALEEKPGAGAGELGGGDGDLAVDVPYDESAQEICDGFDNDADGDVDETCICQPGE